MQILNNPWITGVGGGVISGFIVYFITDWLLSKKQDKEYSQKITTANNEVLYAMRPLVVHKQTPSRSIVESMMESIARKYEVNKDDLINISMLADDLVREVMENAFLDSGQKMEFCKEINELKTETVPALEIEKNYNMMVYQKDKISSQYVSVLLAITATTMGLFAGIVTSVKDVLKFDGLNNLSAISATTFASVLVPVIAMTLTLFLKSVKERENGLRENIKNDLERIKKERGN